MSDYYREYLYYSVRNIGFDHACMISDITDLQGLGAVNIHFLDLKAVPKLIVCFGMIIFELEFQFFCYCSRRKIM